MIHKCGIVLFLSLMATAGAFFLPSATPHGTRMSAGREQDSSTSLERRDLLQNSVGQVLGLSALMLGRANLMGTPQQAQAAVGEGTFTDGERIMCSAVAECMDGVKHTYRYRPTTFIHTRK